MQGFIQSLLVQCSPEIRAKKKKTLQIKPEDRMGIKNERLSIEARMTVGGGRKPRENAPER